MRKAAWPPALPKGTLAFCEDCRSYQPVHGRSFSDEEFLLFTIFCDACKRVVKTLAKRPDGKA